MAVATFPVSACLPVDTQAGAANAGDAHLPIGLWDPATGIAWQGRALLKASIPFTGMSAITEARLYLAAHTASGWHAKGVNTAFLYAYRKTADWSEASGGPTGTDEIWDTGYAALVTNLYAGVELGDQGQFVNAANGTWGYIVVTQMVRRWFEGQPNYGALITNATSEGNATYAKEFYSRRAAGLEPYFWIDYATNTPPTAPTGLTPTGDTVTQTGRTIPLALTRADVDSGDYIGAYQIELATDALATLVDTGAVVPGGTPTSVVHQMTLPAGQDAGNAYYRWRARTRDRQAAWGPYSAYQRFRPNSVPATPAAPTVQTDNLAPTIGGGFSDPDPVAPGASLAAVQVQVKLANAPFTILWDSGAVAKSAAPWTLAYGGSPLAYGTQYAAWYRVLDGLGAWSEWGAYTYWTATLPVGPDNLTPRTTATKVDTLTPTLTIAHSVGFRNDELEVYAANDLASTRLWQRGPVGADYASATTKPYVYAGTALAWGGVYYWRARVELAADGTMTAWTPLVPFRLNAIPTVPTLSVANTDGTPAATASGVQVVTVARPVLTCPFADPDVATDGDTASARSIEVKRKDTGAALAGYPVTTGTTPTHALGTDLVAEVIYQMRWGYRDAIGQPGGSYTYSPWIEVRRSTAPAIAAVSPGASVTDSTPVLDWTLTPVAGKVQATYRVLVFDRGPAGALYPGGEQPVYDSGVRAGSTSDYELPAGLILNGYSYRWEVQATDTDGLAAKLV